MSDQCPSEFCPICKSTSARADFVAITQRGVDGINAASRARGDDISLTVGTKVHIDCRKKYVNKKDIELTKQKREAAAASGIIRKNTRICAGSYDSKSDCLFCGKKVDNETRRKMERNTSSVKTHGFVQSILKCCESRSDEWSFTVKGRIEFYGADLHAADCVYHHSCSVNFRTGRDIPIQFQCCEPTSKRRKVGRPADEVLEEAFSKVCAFLEENDEEQFTVSDLSDKMGEFLREMASDADPFCTKNMKIRLIAHYGEKICISLKDGCKDLVTLRDTADQILRDFFLQSKDGDIEVQKREIIEAAAKLIISEIKDTVPGVCGTYPSSNDLSLEATLEYLPMSVRLLCEKLCVGKEVQRKVAAIGQIIIQAVRPRAVIAPLQLGLAVQLHYMYRSRFLIDTLNTMGMCSSYSEVTRFVFNAACMGALSPIGVMMEYMALLFAGDNVDHNIITLDGKGTFHGMGLIGAVTPSNEQKRTIPRKRIVELAITEHGGIDIHAYRVANRLRRCSVKYEALPEMAPVDAHIDLLWEMSFKYKSTTPNWSGMMHIIYENSEHPGKSSVYFLPMIDMNSSDMTCIYSTLRYVATLARTHKVAPIITFDQPLFWKASEITEEVTDDDQVKEVTVMLGTFHMFMNLLGAIGTLMEGTGIRKLLEVIYGENAVSHILTGKAVQRAFRAHLLLDKCLTHEIVAQIAEQDPSFNQLLDELEEKYVSVLSHETEVDLIQNDETLLKIREIVETKQTDLGTKSKTSKVWICYQNMIRKARNLLKGDRTSVWTHHLRAVSDCLPIFAAAGHFNYLKCTYLYLMKMVSLESTKPEVYALFQKGLFVIRRTDNFWAGLSCDLVIEQALMRALKSRGGLTRGSEMTEKQRVIWTMSAPACSEFNLSMQEFSEQAYTTSDQHKDASKARMERDVSDFNKLLSRLQSYSPFSSDDDALRNIVTGTEANSDVNVDQYESIGEGIISKMIGQPVFSYSFSRKDRVKTVASASSVKVAQDQTIDPALLFQRLLIVAQTGDVELTTVLDHELCPFPPSLFEAKNVLRKADKPQLATAITKFTSSSSDDSVVNEIPVTDRYVLDGGSLLFRLKWKEGDTYDDIAKSYAAFTVRQYGTGTIVVFDGYTGPSTKDNTHQRRNPRAHQAVKLATGTQFVGKRDDFLSNPQNKNSIIRLIMHQLRQHGCYALQAEGDADVEIVKSAVASSLHSSTTLIGEDTDLLVLLLHHVQPSGGHQLYFRSDKLAKTVKVHDIRSIREIMGTDNCKFLLFLHALTGCDTTSRIFGIGKQSTFQRLMKDSSPLRSCAVAFCTPHQPHTVIEKSGKEAMMTLFGGKEPDSLTSLRHKLLSTKIVSAKSFVKPDKLPPTESATKFHSLRVYLQVMTWMGFADGMTPTEWGWTLGGNMLLPVMMDKCAAPPELLKVVHCNCTTRCSNQRCGCKKYGIPCTSACGPCQNDTCDNVLPVEYSDDEDLLV